MYFETQYGLALRNVVWVNSSAIFNIQRPYENWVVTILGRFLIILKEMSIWI